MKCNAAFGVQLLSTADEVGKLQEELELMKPMLAEAVQESVTTMQRIAEDTVSTVRRHRRHRRHQHHRRHHRHHHHHHHRRHHRHHKMICKTPIACDVNIVIDGIAQWFGRRSLTGRLSLTCCWSMVGLLSAMGQPARPTQPPIPPGSINEWVVIHVITWITEVETIKRQTRVVYGWSVVGQSLVAGLAYGL